MCKPEKLTYSEGIFVSMGVGPPLFKLWPWRENVNRKNLENLNKLNQITITIKQTIDTIAIANGDTCDTADIQLISICVGPIIDSCRQRYREKLTCCVSWLRRGIGVVISINNFGDIVVRMEIPEFRCTRVSCRRSTEQLTDC